MTVYSSRWLLDASEDHIASIFMAGRHSVGSHSFVDPFSITWISHAARRRLLQRSVEFVTSRCPTWLVLLKTDEVPFAG